MLLRRVLALVALTLVAVVLWFLVELLQPFTGTGHGARVVTIPPSAGATQIGNILARDGIVSSGFFFGLRARLDGDRGKLRQGRFTMPLDTSYANALRILTTAPKAAPVTELTIIPGESRYQIAQILRRQGIAGNYLSATEHSSLLDPARYGAPRNTPYLEGFLFPDTYQLRTPVKLSALVADELTTFKREFATVNLSYARSKNLTPYDVVKIASLADAEAAAPSDLPKVTSVIYNRLREGMYLGLDTTVAYIFHDYTGNLTETELNSSSPWNTTNRPGLPPTPIDSPSLSAIQAAAHPARTSYLYFIVKVCGDGKLFFTNSYTQFLAASRAYNAAVEQRGIEKAEFCSR